MGAMRLIALAQPLTDLEGTAKVLAEACGLAPAEARMRLQTGPPFLVARLADDSGASALAALRAAGLSAFEVVEPLPDPKARLMARELAFEASALKVIPRSGPAQSIAYGDISLLLLGMRVARSSSVKTTTTKKLAIGAAVITGGLKVTKTETRTERTESEQTDQELKVIATNGSVAIISEGGIVFSCLGAAVQPGRLANFQLVVRKIRESSPQARFDDRLLRLGRRPPTVIVPSAAGGSAEGLDVWSELVEVGARLGVL
jgi:hypothetical protein